MLKIVTSSDACHRLEQASVLESIFCEGLVRLHCIYGIPQACVDAISQDRIFSHRISCIDCHNLCDTVNLQCRHRVSCSDFDEVSANRIMDADERASVTAVREETWRHEGRARDRKLRQGVSACMQEEIHLSLHNEFKVCRARNDCGSSHCMVPEERYSRTTERALEHEVLIFRVH